VIQLIIRFLLILVCSISGFFIARGYYGFPQSLIGLLFGFLVSIIVIQIEQVIRKVSIRSIVGGVIGTIIGLSIASLIAYSLRFWANQEIVTWIYVALTCILGYLGLVIGSKKSEEISFPAFGPFKKGVKSSNDYRILDTSVIIDGRIADISDTGFIEGDLIVPQFILDELQHIADSSDSMKRSRGRRGLDVLNRMQLVALAKKMHGKLVTNDFNLNKVAELQGIKILNVNELANALKPVVLPGEVVSVKIIKEGKEPGQGVAYLDDGTMVVVDHANKHLGENVEALVTSVLQTTAGRMIFSELKEVVPEKKVYRANSPH
jgi:uncharacterized protein YacL